MLAVASPEDALKMIDEHFGAIRTAAEELPIYDAYGRVLAEDIHSREDVPAFDRSTMDGYAVNASDTFGASETLMAMLKPVGTVHMGETPDFTIGKGECAYIPTGGRLPEGSNGVVMVEYTEDFGDGYIYAQSSIAPGANVIYRGDDVKEGALLLKTGTVIRPQEMGALAAMGYPKVKVFQRLKVGILSTGDELVQTGQKPEKGQVRDINTYSVSAAASVSGFEVIETLVLKDDEALLEAADAGVEIIAVDCEVRPGFVCIDAPVAVDLSRA